MEPLPIVTPFYLDKSLWLAVLSPLLAMISKRLGLNLEPSEVVALVLPVVVFIVSSKWKQTSLQKAQIQANVAMNGVTSETQAAAILRGK